MNTGNTHVNPYYLDHVIDLSSTAEVEAGEDIYSARGIKLLSKGARLDPSMQERLIRHKLAKPLETSLALASRFDDAHLQAEVDNLLQHDTHGKIVGDRCNAAVRALFNSIDFRQPGLDLLLALLQKSDAAALQYTVLSAVLAVRLGIEHELDHTDLQALALAGLLHEVGYLYLDPKLRNGSKCLALPAWRQRVAQPLIAGMALSHLPGLTATAVSAVREQHERIDGSGYPVGMQGSAIALCSQLFSVACLTARLLQDHGDSGLWQAKVAMQLVAGEYGRPVMTCMQQMVLHSQVPPPASQGGCSYAADPLLPALFEHIAQLQSGLLELEDRFGNSTREAQQWLRRMTQRLFSIQRTFSTTGLDALASVSAPEGDEIHGELLLISREIRRRLHDLGKTAVLQVAPLSPQMQDAAHPWMEKLLNS